MNSCAVRINDGFTSEILAQNLAGASEYSEMVIENKTGSTVYLLDQSGDVRTMAVSSYLNSSKEFVIRQISRNTFDIDRYGRCKHISDASNRKIKEFRLSLANLQNPVYIPQLGVVVGLTNDEKLKKAHPLLKNGDLAQSMAYSIQNRVSGTTSIVCSVNSYDCRVNKVYTIINNAIVLCNVTHNSTEPEKIILVTSTGIEETPTNSLITLSDSRKLGVDDLKFYQVETEESGVWTFSTDRETLAKYLADKRNERNRLLSSAEVQNQINLRTEEITKQNEELTKRLALMKSKVENLQMELDGRNGEANKTHEEKMYAMKLEQAKLDAAITDKRLKSEESMLDVKISESQRKREDVERESEHDKLIFEQKLATEKMQQELDIIKAKTDAQIAESKVAVAASSERAAANSETASVVKAAAVIVPAAISLGLAAYTFKASAAAITAGAVSTPIGALVAAAATIGYLACPRSTKESIKDKVKDTFDFICNTAKSTASRICGAMSSVGKGAKKIVSGTVSSLASGIKSAGSTIKSCVSGTYNAVKSCASKIASGTKSLISNTWNTMLSWF